MNYVQDFFARIVIYDARNQNFWWKIKIMLGEKHLLVNLLHHGFWPPLWPGVRPLVSPSLPLSSVFFFFAWTLKVPVNLIFSTPFTGTFLRSRALFGENSRARGCCHGHFFGRFHGHFCVVHGDFFFVHGQFCSSRARIFHCSRPFLKFTGTFFPLHGHFFPVQGHILVNCSRAKKIFTGIFFENIHGHFFKVHGKKKKHWMKVYRYGFNPTEAVFYKSTLPAQEKAELFFA